MHSIAYATYPMCFYGRVAGCPCVNKGGGHGASPVGLSSVVWLISGALVTDGRRREPWRAAIAEGYAAAFFTWANDSRGVWRGICMRGLTCRDKTSFGIAF